MKRYTRTHEWFEPVGTDAARVRLGITAHAAQELGSIVFVELPAPGRVVARGESLAVIESVKAVGEVYAPFPGTVVEVGAGLAENPERIGEDPEGTGWLVVLAVDDPAELEQGMDAEAYQQMLAAQA